MAKFRLGSLKATTRIDPRFKAMNHIKTRIDSRLSKLKERADRIVQGEIEKHVKKSRVYKALTNPPLGVRGYDLPAEFGLFPGEGEEAANLMLYILKGTGEALVEPGVIIKRTRQGSGVSVKTTVHFLNPKKYLNHFTKRPFWHQHPKKYKNKKAFARRVRMAGGTFSEKSERIDWMQWLLEAHRGDRAIHATLPSVKQYGISYDIDPAFSRSGRALMLNRNKPRNRDRMPLKYFPYTFPEVAKPKAGAKNFIDEIANDPKFITNLDKRVRAAFSRTLRIGV